MTTLSLNDPKVMDNKRVVLDQHGRVRYRYQSTPGQLCTLPAGWVLRKLDDYYENNGLRPVTRRARALSWWYELPMMPTP